MPFTLIEALIVTNAIAIFSLGGLALKQYHQVRTARQATRKPTEQTTRQRKNTTSHPEQYIFFTLTCLACVAWLVTDLLVDRSDDLASALLWSKLTFLASILIMDLFFYFILIFPQRSKSQLARYTPLIFLLPALLIALLPTDLIIKNVFFLDPIGSTSWTIGFTPGALYPLFIIHQAFFLIASLATIALKYHRADKTPRLQLKYLAAGFALTTISSIIFGVILPEIFATETYAKLAPASLIFTIIATAITLTKHYLLNIKVLAAEALAFFISLILMTNILLANNRNELILRLVLFLVIGGLSIWLVHSVRQLEQANRQLEALSERKSTFVSMASHELRTPLTSLQGYLQLLRSDGSADQQNSILQKCQRNLRELSHFIDSMLDVTRIETGKIKYARELVDMTQLIQEVVVEMKPVVAGKKLDIRVDLPGDLPPTQIDREKIKHVLRNLIDNAIKYTERGSITISALVQTAPDTDPNTKTDQIIIKITDTGSGISKSECAQIFNKYVRTDGSWKINQQGAGLGLYIARSFVKGHGGQIWVANEDGHQKSNQGATFCFSLPI